MAQVLPAERDLRRVIGDADGAGDRQVDGLGEQELLEIYRSMVQLRTYDERSVVYHKQGRIGTYANVACARCPNNILNSLRSMIISMNAGEVCRALFGRGLNAAPLAFRKHDPRLAF